MAFNTTIDKATKLSVNLGNIVAAQVSSLSVVRKREQSIKEAAFQQTVIDQGLSYDAQLAYRKQQLSEEKNKPGAVDEEYLSTIESSISDIRKLIKFQKIRDDYLGSYENLKSGKISLQTHLDFLTTQYNNETDETIRKELRDEISSVRTQISESEVNTLNNRVLLAEKDGTVNALQSAIDSVSSRKAFADLNGNAEESSAWDVSLTSLKKQLNEARVANASHDIDFKITQYGGNALKKLDMLSTEIQTADDSTPVTIGGKTYTSAKDYWNGTLGAYINGSGTGNFSNFISDFEGEVKNKIDTVSRVNKFGFVPVPTLEAIQNDYSQILARPEFAMVADKVNTSKVAALSYGVDKSASALIESSTESLQLQSGQEALKSLGSKFGIDTTSRQFELQSKVISKGSQLPAIKSATEQLKEVGAQTPPEELPAGTSPEELMKTGQDTTVKPPVSTGVVTPPAPANPPAAEPQYEEYTIQQGDTLSGIAQTKLGDSNKYQDIAKVNNISDPNKIVAGTKIKIPKI